MYIKLCNKINAVMTIILVWYVVTYPFGQFSPFLLISVADLFLLVLQLVPFVSVFCFSLIPAFEPLFLEEKDSNLTKV